MILPTFTLDVPIVGCAECGCTTFVAKTSEVELTATEYAHMVEAARRSQLADQYGSRDEEGAELGQMVKRLLGGW